MKDELKQLKDQLNELEERIRELEERLPAHSVKPSMMTELCELEDKRDTLFAKIAELKGETD